MILIYFSNNVIFLYLKYIRKYKWNNVLFYSINDIIILSEYQNSESSDESLLSLLSESVDKNIFESELSLESSKICDESSSYEYLYFNNLMDCYKLLIHSSFLHIGHYL